MDPNRVRNTDYINAYGFGDDGGALLSDFNDWDLHRQYNHPFDLTPSNAFDRFDADTFGLHAHAVSNSGSSEPFVPPSSASRVEKSMPGSAFGAVASMPDPSVEDTDFSETVRYISQILLEENFEDKPCMCYNPLSLQDTEKSFYDALNQEFPLSPNEHPLDIHQNLESPDGVSAGSFPTGSSGGCSNSNSSSTSNSSSENHLSSHDFKTLSPDTPVSGDSSLQFDSHSHLISHVPSQLHLPQHALTSIGDGVFDLDPSATKLLAQNIFSNADSILQFKRGLEEASKFLPPGPRLSIGLESSSMHAEESKRRVEKAAVPVMVENDAKERSNRVVAGPYHIVPATTKAAKNTAARSLDGVKSRKHHARQGDDGEEERCNKQSAVSVEEESEISEMFDKVLLSVENVPLSAEQQDGLVVDTQLIEQPHSSEGGRSRSKKKGRKKETVDLRTLLVLCAQAVSANDQRTANELLKQIRQHSLPFGDAYQRLARYFADGLEARMAGTGPGIHIFYASLSYKKFSAADFLKAYQVFISACPFKKFAHFFSNKMILNIAEKAETLHIVDFGILYGFQWPILIKFIAKRDGGPPKLRITGIEYPQAGFRPTERIEETGRRLAKYCKRFNVPFEYKAIASRHWETIQIEDLNIKDNEVVAVNCLVRFKNLLEETVEVNSPRNAVLNLIRRINPAIFAQTVVNGSYNAPFFLTRFREALFHYSAIYDMFDTLIPRNNSWRSMLEREFLGREIMNVVACEGLERVERPETYKQWQARNSRAGFRQLPLDKALMAKFRSKLKEWYQHHKDFVFDEDNNWMLQGWKGRILYASSCWVPA
ncbi:hypothetical protein HN51_019076 [Arachis hypogaea]|uniref:Uncharacterized protein n=1 Tax=Arachis hypogaea TaxID=3818 RepID=A0A445BVW6_ARAHY|nr:scarecrow-like protein 34 [Arachis hypogaea]QHO30626.1 Scarecrow-like protein [Arachis hypogaea]RYR42721.1 hypothetical protein Ahy_A08g039167 [Arachis hypogaea]